MSYDYTALTTAIATHRREAVAATSDTDRLTALQSALESFETLSQHCPMTPILWMHYAATASQLILAAFSEAASDQEVAAANESATQTRLDTLALGLQEFPGSVLLQYHAILLLWETEADIATKEEAVAAALEKVGRGAHRNEGDWVVGFYRLQAALYANAGRTEAVVESFRRRAATPTKDANDTILQEFQTLILEHNMTVTPEQLQTVEQGRRRESKQFSRFATWEDEVDMAMHQEGIMARHHIGGTDPDWDTMLQSGDQTYLMGLGGRATALAFVKYALAYHKCKWPSTANQIDQDVDAEDVALSELELAKLALAVYERGVAECPTVESIWLSYIRCLVEIIQRGNPFELLLQGVVNRAVRNCPYSLPLMQQKLNTTLILAERGAVVLDPDTLMDAVQQALDAKFLPGPARFLELYMTAIMTVKRRILSLLAQDDATNDMADLAYDDVEALPTNINKANASTNDSVDPDCMQEVSDLCDDLSDMYESVEALLRKHYSSWSEGRSLLWKERAQTETLFLVPLKGLLFNDNIHQQSDSKADEALKCFDKAVRTHAPPHPDTYSAYIQHFMSATRPPTEKEVLTKLRRIRGLYQKAVNAVGKPKNASLAPASVVSRDFETALTCMCHDWIQFESVFGSERSRSRAAKVVEKKLFKANASAAILGSHGGSTHMSSTKAVEADVPNDVNTKRKNAERRDAIEQPTKKKQKTHEATDEVMEQEESKKESKASKIMLPKVRIGNLVYPAHPLTVRVSNLSLDTNDMDLVDAFRPKCGAIVHAKILREKHFHHQGKGDSKGWGLVQFEDRESVEKALALNDVLGLKEKVINVERSHVAAAGLVPPGMHRVNPKGEGKSTKRHQKRREQTGIGADPERGASAKLDDLAIIGKPTGKPKESKPASQANLLSLRPRSVGHGVSHRKTKLSLNGKTNERSDRNKP